MEGIDLYKYTSEIAYIVGILTTDGNLSKDGRHINFTSKDKQLLIMIRKMLGKSAKIGDKKGGYTKEST